MKAWIDTVSVQYQDLPSFHPPFIYPSIHPSLHPSILSTTTIWAPTMNHTWLHLPENPWDSMDLTCDLEEPQSIRKTDPKQILQCPTNCKWEWVLWGDRWVPGLNSHMSALDGVRLVWEDCSRSSEGAWWGSGRFELRALQGLTEEGAGAAGLRLAGWAGEVLS